MSHVLEVKLSRRAGVEFSLRCTEPEGAECRLWCQLPECDGEPGSSHGLHTLAPVPCGVVEWFGWDSSASMEGYTGEPTALRSGAIEVTYCGEDGFEWHYAAPEQPPLPEPADCPHCIDGHREPQTRPWAAWVATERDSDGQPTHLRVAPTGGAHVAESDAEWLRELIRNERGGD